MDRVILKFADIGELGWAMYLSGHINWLKDQGKKVMVYTNRPSMFDCTTLGYEHPFTSEPEGFGRLGVLDSEIREYFNNQLAHKPKYNCDKSVLSETIYKPYKCDKLGWDYVVIVPRHRQPPFDKRNLSLKFYNELYTDLAKDYLVYSVGAENGAYHLTCNCIDLVGKTSVADLITLLTNANFVVGSQSAPPKIALLQGTPTYMIGNEKERHTVTENWSGTNVGFYETTNYNGLEYSEVRDNIRDWINEHRKR